MKRLFNTRKKSEEDMREQGNTLDRIVKDKEGVKKRLEEEEKSFMNRKREYERKMIEFEKQVNVLLIIYDTFKMIKRKYFNSVNIKCFDYRDFTTLLS